MWDGLGVVLEWFGVAGSRRTRYVALGLALVVAIALVTVGILVT